MQDIIKETEELKYKIKIELKEHKNFKKCELAKYKKGLDLLQMIINSRQFKERVLAASFTETNGMSSEEIYSYLISGQNKFYDEVDHNLEIYTSMYFSWKRVVGYTYPSTVWTWLNRRVFRKMKPSSIASNCLHEYAHNCGWGHKKKKSTSVPYQLGKVARVLGDFVLDGGKLVIIR